MINPLMTSFGSPFLQASSSVSVTNPLTGGSSFQNDVLDAAAQTLIAAFQQAEQQDSSSSSSGVSGTTGTSSSTSRSQLLSTVAQNLGISPTDLQNALQSAMRSVRHSHRHHGGQGGQSDGNSQSPSMNLEVVVIEINATQSASATGSSGSASNGDLNDFLTDPNVISQAGSTIDTSA